MGWKRIAQFQYLQFFFSAFIFFSPLTYANSKCSLKIRSFNIGKYRPTLKAEGYGIWKWDRKLKLQSPEGVLRLGFLGAGSAFAATKFQSNFAIIKGNTVLWVDLGTKASHRLSEFGLSDIDIDHLLITHAHADHVGGVEELAFKARYLRPHIGKVPVKPSLYLPKEFADELWNTTLKGSLQKSSEGLLELSDFFFLKPAEPVLDTPFKAWKTKVGEGENAINITLIQVRHISPLPLTFYTVGLVIDEKVLISGDSQFNPQLLKAVLDYYPTIETIFHDAQSSPSKVHASIDQLATLPTELKRRIFLYHMDDGMRPEQVKKLKFKGITKAFPIFYQWE